MNGPAFIMRGVLGIPALALRVIIRLYQVFVAPALGPRCRYLPSCSAYAAEAITKYGAAAGVVLATKRIARCHPWCDGGFDPVPEHFSLFAGHRGCTHHPRPLIPFDHHI